MRSYVPFSRTKGYEAIELGASTSQSKPGLPRFADITQVGTQSRSSVAFGVSGTDLSNLNEVLCSSHNYTCMSTKLFIGEADLVICIIRIRTKLD